jgi:hypothetical protein
MSSESTRPADGAPAARPVDFDVPTTPQAADKAFPSGDRTPQVLNDVAARGKRVVAVGFDESFNISRPLILSSDDGGSNWARRSLDAESVVRSSTFEGATDIAAGPSGFVAVGSSNDGPALWNSPDGISWNRQPTDRKVFRTTDGISALTASPQGFAMVGSSSISYGGSPNHLVYWQSPDGVAWQRADGPTIGLKPAAVGSMYAAEIVAQGKTVVVSGGLSTPGRQQADRSAAVLVLVRRWQALPQINRPWSDSERLPRVQPGAGGRRREIRCPCPGNGFDDSEEGSWDGVVLEGGTSGRSWQVVAKPWVLGSRYQDSPGTLARAGKDLVATSQMTTTTEDVIVAAGPTWRQLADHTDTPSQLGPGNQYVFGSVAVDGDAVLVGSTNRSGTAEPAVWRYHSGTVKPVTLPKEASAGRASAHITRILAAGQDFVAVGDTGAPTSWTQASSGWQGSSLPGRKNGVDLSLADAATTADGQVVAVGEKSLPIGSRAALWVRGKNGRWIEIDSPTFGVQAKSPFGGPSPTAVVRNGKLLITGFDTPPAGGGYYVLELDVPR